MDPDMFGGMMSMFAPKPGQDPFALGAGLATNPDAYVNELSKLGPPPAPGQGFPDYVASAAQNAGPQPAVGNPPPSVSGAPQIPPPAMPPRTPPGTLGGPGGGTGMDMGSLFPGPPGGWFQKAPPSMGPEFNEAFGSVPGTGAPGAPGTSPPPVPGGLADATAPPPTQGAKPDILAAADDARRQPAAGSPAPPDLKKFQEAMKASSSLLAGVKAPPPPTTQHISSPSIPRAAGAGGANISALIQALTQGGSPAVAPLRLGNALYAGGRGLY